MINDDFVILDLFSEELGPSNVCAVYGRVYWRDLGWKRVPDADQRDGGAMLSVLDPKDASLVPLVEERDLVTYMAKSIIELRADHDLQRRPDRLRTAMGSTSGLLERTR